MAMPREFKLPASEFKAKCLDLLDQIAARKITRLTVTKHGRPVAVLAPPASREEEAERIFGALRGRLEAPQGFDFTAPVLDEPLGAAEGKLHE
jgi:prevent-host-death family protein